MRLLIKKNKKSGIIDYELISYIPDKESLIDKLLLGKNKHNDLLKDFSGHVYHKNIGGETLYLEMVKDGIVTKKLYKARNNNKFKIKSFSTTQNLSASNCESVICIEVFAYDSSCDCFAFICEDFYECPPPVSSPYPGVAEENGILSFESNQAFYDLYENLDEQVETHNAAFYDTKSTLTDDQIETIEIQQNFDEVEPLRNFENYLNFSSLRAKIEIEENIWMDNTVLDPNTDPDNIYSEPDDIIRTFFNENQMLKIAGIHYSTPTSDEISLNNTTGNPANCRTKRRYSRFNPSTYANDTKNAKYVASFNGYYLGILGARIVARTKNYKQKNNGRWKKFATMCKARMIGTIVKDDCTGSLVFGTKYKEIKRRRSYKASNIKWTIYAYIKSGEMVGEHTVVEPAFFHAQYLTW